MIGAARILIVLASICVVAACDGGASEGSDTSDPMDATATDRSRERGSEDSSEPDSDAVGDLPSIPDDGGDEELHAGDGTSDPEDLDLEPSDAYADGAVDGPFDTSDAERDADRRLDEDTVGDPRSDDPDDARTDPDALADPRDDLELLGDSADTAPDLDDVEGFEGCRTPLADSSVPADAFGYYVGRTCPHQFVDLMERESASYFGTGNDLAVMVDLGLSDFRLYGAPIEDLVFAMNGYLSTATEEDGSDTTNDCPMPAPLRIPGARLSPLHQNLDSAIEGEGLWHEHFDECPRPSSLVADSLPCDIFQWEGRYRGGAPRYVSFEVVLYEGGAQIVFAYRTADDGGAESSTGIQHENGTLGLTVTCDEDGGIVPGTSVCLYPPAPCRAFAVE